MYVDKKGIFDKHKMHLRQILSTEGFQFVKVLILVASLLTNLSFSGFAHAQEEFRLDNQQEYLDALVQNSSASFSGMTFQEPLTSSSELLSLFELVTTGEGLMILSPVMLSVVGLLLNQMTTQQTILTANNDGFHIAQTNPFGGTSSYMIIAVIAGVALVVLLAIILITALWPFIHMQSKPKAQALQEKYQYFSMLSTVLKSFSYTLAKTTTYDRYNLNYSVMKF